MAAGNGIRRYVATISAKPNLGAPAGAPDRTTRKVAAAAALGDRDRTAMTALVPQLERLRVEGLVTDYEQVPLVGAMILSVPDATAGRAYDALRGVAGLGRIVRDRTVQLREPSPPVAGASSAPPSTPQLEWSIDRINADEVWKLGDTGQGVVIGIADTGANVAHDALRARYRGSRQDGSFDDSYNFFDAVGGRPAAYDDHGHGSHVTGTAVGQSEKRLIGVAPGASFIAAKIFDKRGRSAVSTMLKGLSWLLAPTDSTGHNPDPAKAPDIVSNSWGDDDKGGATLTYLDAWKAFEVAGIVPVAAAGNNGPAYNAIDAPGSYPQSITVAATDEQDVVAPFSSRGLSPIKNPDGTRIFKPDVAAPGVNILSAGLNPKKYWWASGTSMATPAVAGVVALILSRHPNLTTEQIRPVLAGSAKDLGASGPDIEYGAGRVDALAAVQLADRLYGTPPAAARRT